MCFFQYTIIYEKILSLFHANHHAFCLKYNVLSWRVVPIISREIGIWVFRFSFKWALGTNMFPTFQCIKRPIENLRIQSQMLFWQKIPNFKWWIDRVFWRWECWAYFKASLFLKVRDHQNGSRPLLTSKKNILHCWFWDGQHWRILTDQRGSAGGARLCVTERSDHQYCGSHCDLALWYLTMNEGVSIKVSFC